MSNRGMPPLPNSPEQNSGDVPKQSVVKSPPIKVVALRAGFYKQCRKVQGDEFEVEKFEHLGSWMKCVDKAIAKKHYEAMEARKVQLRELAASK